MEEKKVNYFDTPAQRQQRGAFAQATINHLLGFDGMVDEDEIREDLKEYED